MKIMMLLVRLGSDKKMILKDGNHINKMMIIMIMLMMVMMMINEFDKVAGSLFLDSIKHYMHIIQKKIGLN